ncbi:MAG: SWIM zinc finger family protein [Nanoarchaeota archaeon]|nr:SWIM zinc finger family protein [Nanoarchaeota archaeon]
MNVRKLKTKYKVESQSKKGTFYYVDLSAKTCSCPEYNFRMRKIGGICKHINAVEEYVSGEEHPTVLTKDEKKKRQKHVKELGKHAKEIDEKEKKYSEIISYVKEQREVDSISLIEKFGQEYVDDMIRLGELLEKDGKIRLLE